MLNKNKQRELCYLCKIDKIEPIVGSDNCECAEVGGWRVMVHKGEFKEGDPAIYFEIDSLLDSTNPAFAFMDKKHYKVKTQRYTFGGKGLFISQGLLMSPKDFGWAGYRSTKDLNPKTTDVDSVAVKDDKGKVHYENDESRFLTKQLNITYAVASDNKRKAASADKYKLMAMRHPKLGKKWWWRKLYKSNFGKKVLFVFFGRRSDKKSEWPSWVRKTDEERVECCLEVLQDKSSWIATEKLDGSSTSATVYRRKFGKWDYYICSRNVVFNKSNKPCFYDTNIYVMMSEKYHFKEALIDICKKYNLKWATLQGETFGGSNPLIQKNTYDMKECDFRGFNLVFSDRGRLNSVDSAKIMKEYGIKWVPILNENYILPDTLDELRAYVHSKPSVINGKIKEGIVFRSKDGTRSFKCVDPEYLLKFHQ